MSYKSRLVLVDGSGFIFRAFYALPPMTSPDGTPVNAVYGFMNMLMRLLREQHATHLGVIFDAGRINFRHRLYEPYKANRVVTPPELVPQFTLIRQAVEALNLKAVELEGFEADDLIASYIEAAKGHYDNICVVSSDKDLMQLLAEGVSLLDPMKQKFVTPDDVEAKFGVGPEKVREVQALTGDSSDNIPGVKGIGPKTAGELIRQYGSLEGVLAAIPEMKASKRKTLLEEGVEIAKISYQLVGLCKEVPLPVLPEELLLQEADKEKLAAYLAGLGFNSLLQRYKLQPPPVLQAVGSEALPNLRPQGRQGSFFAEEMPADPGSPREAFGHYKTVQDEVDLQKLCEEIKERGILALDTETDNILARKASLTGISLAFQSGEAFYIPLAHQTDASQLSLETVREKLNPLLEDLSILKIFHNAKYDLTVLKRAGFAQAAPLDDTMVISYVLATGLHGHGMDELSLRYLGHRAITYDEVTGKGRNRISFAEVDLSTATAYAAEDADITLRLWELLKPRLVSERLLTLYETTERPLIPVLLAMEEEGIQVNTGALKEASREFAKNMAVYEEKAHDLALRVFNIASPVQLGQILFDELKLAGGKRLKKSGSWATDAETLQNLADRGEALPLAVLEWRKLAKLKSTYADALTEQADAFSRVHTNFSMTMTSTGRLASSDPNLQNIPIRTEEGAKIRKAFTAKEGFCLLSADYSQIELRLLAHIADVALLKESFLKGEDIHTRTASEVFGIPQAGMDPLIRRRAKAINFGIIYGISAFGLAKQLGVEPGEAKRYIEAYFARYPEISGYMKRTGEEAAEQGFVTTFYGRRCFVADVRNKNAVLRGYAERQAINAPVQGGAADIIKLAMVRLPFVLEEAGLSAKILLQVHDELVLEVPEAEADITRQTVKEVMENVVTLSVPLVVDTGIGHNWSEAH